MINPLRLAAAIAVLATRCTACRPCAPRQNFPISGLRPLEPFVVAQVWIKKAAALTHRETGRLDARLADAIIAAADEVLAGSTASSSSWIPTRRVRAPRTT
jgi:fumarate hydratase class II